MTGSDKSEEGWNFRALFAQGVFFNAARSLASPQLVLPFLYMALGAPTFFAGLITPLVQLSQLFSQVISAPIIGSSASRKWYLVLCNCCLACVLGIVAVAATRDTSATFIVAVFLLVALAIGAIQGVNALAFGDLIGRALRPEVRSRLLFTVAAIAGALAVAAAWLTPWIAGNVTPLKEHLTLLWIGIGVTAMAAVPCALLRENPERSVNTIEHEGFFTKLRAGLSHAEHLGWFRRYLVARSLLVSVVLAMPFYTVHGATLHASKAGSLSSFVIAASLGAVVAGPVWARLSRTSHKKVLLLSSLLAAAAGTWAIVIDSVVTLQSIGLHALVFGVVSAASQGVSASQTLFLVEAAPPDDRAYFLAAANGLAGIIGVIVAFAFGAIAHFQGAVWPVGIVVVLNLFASLACFRL